MSMCSWLGSAGSQADILAYLLHQIEGLEAHVGRRGRIRIKGGLPFTFDSAAIAEAVTTSSAELPSARQPNAGSALLVDVHNLELRVRNMYTGALLLLESKQYNLPREALVIALNEDLCYRYRTFIQKRWNVEAVMGQSLL